MAECNNSAHSEKQITRYALITENSSVVLEDARKSSVLMRTQDDTK